MHPDMKSEFAQRMISCTTEDIFAYSLQPFHEDVKLVVAAHSDIRFSTDSKSNINLSAFFKYNSTDTTCF